MAHECPECGCQCHCGGDCDDLLLNMDRYVLHCRHCQESEIDYSPEDEEWEAHEKA